MRAAQRSPAIQLSPAFFSPLPDGSQMFLKQQQQQLSLSLPSSAALSFIYSSSMSTPPTPPTPTAHVFADRALHRSGRVASQRSEPAPPQINNRSPHFVSLWPPL